MLMGIALLTIFTAVVVAVLFEDRQDSCAELGEFHIEPKDNDIMYLDGEWAFEWERLLEAQEAVRITQMVDVPSSWNANGVADEPMRAFGAATYALKIIGATAGESYTLRIPFLHMTGRYYINDTMIYEAGKVALTKDAYKPKAGIRYATFTAPAASFMLTAQIANFDHSRGGMLSSIQIGKSDVMMESRIRQAGFDNAILYIICVLFLIASFFIIWFKGKRASGLYLLAVLLMFWQHVTSGDKLIAQWFPEISVYLYIRLQYIVLFLLPPVLVQQIYAFCNHNELKHTTKTLFRVILSIGAALTVVCAAAPMWFFTWLANLGYILSTIYIALAVILVAFAMIRSPESKGILFYLGACVAMGIGSIYDFLNRLTIIHGVFANMMLGFIVASLFLGMSMVRQMIEIRQNAFMYRHAYLIAQVKPHFVFNALNTVIGTIREDADEAERITHAFSNFLRSAIDQEKMKDAIPLKNEIETLKAYLEIELARHDDISIHMDVEPIPDILLPPFTLQPLVENAIKHGLGPKQGGGTIAISCEEQKDRYVVRVRDDGVGMSIKQVRNILEAFKAHRDIQSRIGLANVNERFYKVYRTPICIESESGKGTCIQLFVPKKHR